MENNNEFKEMLKRRAADFLAGVQTGYNIRQLQEEDAELSMSRLIADCWIGYATKPRDPNDFTAEDKPLIIEIHEALYEVMKGEVEDQG